jgi:hypothetical protein
LDHEVFREAAKVAPNSLVELAGRNSLKSGQLGIQDDPALDGGHTKLTSRASALLSRNLRPKTLPATP